MRSAIGIVHLLNRDYKDVDSEDDSTVTVHIQEALQNFWILKGSGDEFKLVGGALSSIAKLHVVISTCISWYSMGPRPAHPADHNTLTWPQAEGHLLLSRPP